MSKPAILTLCSSIAPGANVAPTLGHVWIKIEAEGRKPQTFGLFSPETVLAESRYVRDQNIVTGGSDVRRNLELHKGLKNVYREKTIMRWALSPEKVDELMDLIRAPQKYSQWDNNCTDWACGVVSKVVGVPLSSKLETLADVGGSPQLPKDAPADAPRVRVSTPRSLPLAFIKPAFHGAASDMVIDPRNPPPMSVRLLPNSPPAEGSGAKLRIILATPFLAGLAAQAVSAKPILQS